MSPIAAMGLVVVSIVMSNADLLRHDIPKIDLHVFKRALGDATATFTGRLQSIAVVLDLFSLTSHARFASVENW